MDSTLLTRVLSAEDLKNLTVSELYQLADEMRDFLIHHIAETGGHLASNLGVVEMMLAIHKTFDTRVDRLVLDVGHQCYVHKILTGRRDGFQNLRKFGGMSGFLRPGESVHDACVSGHASNSVSVALGMARARTLQNEDYSVIAVIGDGALTGGLAYEALNDAGQSGESLIVILNDNGMSITKNVGAMTAHLAKLRLKPHYLHFRDRYRKFMKKAPGGMAVDKVIHSVKNSLKSTFLPSSFFENMGFTYLGPADGHDMKYMLYLLELARDLARPVLIHLTTTKGKGYKFSEENPQAYHGVACFDIDSGAPVKKSGQTFSAVFGETMCALAREDIRICAITAAMQSGVGLSQFARSFPHRFFDVGIAEGHAVAMAAGLAAQLTRAALMWRIYRLFRVCVFYARRTLQSLLLCCAMPRWNFPVRSRFVITAAAKARSNSIRLQSIMRPISLTRGATLHLFLTVRCSTSCLKRQSALKKQEYPAR